MIKEMECSANHATTSQSEKDGCQKERTIRLYNRLAGIYSFFRVKDGLDTVLDLLKLEEGNKILDIGTGPGIYALHIAKNWPTCTVHGIDLCDNFIKIARKKALKCSSANIHFDKGDAEQMHYEDNAFNRVLCCSALVLLPDKMQAVKEAHRVLKPGGIAVFKELLHEKFLHKELFYCMWKVYVRTLGLLFKEVRGLKRSDYEGQKMTESNFTSLLENSPFSDYNVFRKGTRLYAVCRK